MEDKYEINRREDKRIQNQEQYDPRTVGFTPECHFSNGFQMGDGMFT